MGRSAFAARPTVEDRAGPNAPALLARLREVAPVAWVPAIEGWLVTSHAVAVRVMRDADTFTVDDPSFSTARVVGPSMLSLDAADDRRHRAPFVDPFWPRAVDTRYAAEITEAARGGRRFYAPRRSGSIPTRSSPTPL